MDIPLSDTKLHFPSVRTRRIRRERLYARLDPLLGHKVGVVSAAAGYGKTTLAADWLDHLAQRHDIVVPQIAWLSLDAMDNRPARWCAALITVLGQVYPDAGRSLWPLLNLEDLDWIETLLLTLLNDIASSPVQCVLVLDDYHLITNNVIHSALDFVIDNLPPQLHLLICSRTEPPLALDRLRARATLVEIHQDQLAFAADEAADFFQRIMGIELASDQVQVLSERTEGWIAGLQLAALSLRDTASGEYDHLIETFSGSHRHVAGFLMNEAFLRQSSDVQTFLLRTSVLDRFCGPLCEAVVADPEIDGSKMLDHLRQGEMFLVPLDATHVWFRYHHLFQDLLQARLNKECPGLEKNLHLRASDWYQQQGQAYTAIDQALASGAPERAAQLIDGLGCRLTQEGSDVQTLAWIAQIPKALHRDYPWLRVAQLVALCGMERYDTLTPLIDSLDADAKRYPDLPIATCVLLVRAWQAMRTAYEPETLLRYGLEARQQLAALPQNDTTLLLQASAWQYIGQGHWNLGHRSKAEEAFVAVVTASQAARSVPATLRALGHLARFFQAVGPLSRCAEVCRQGIDLARLAWAEQQEPSPPADQVAMLEGLLALMLLLWDHLDEAQAHAERAVKLFEQSGSQPGQYLEFGLINLFWVHSARGEHAQAYAILRQIDSILIGCSQAVRWQVEPKLVRLRIGLSHAETAWRPLLHKVESWVDQAMLDPDHVELNQVRDYEALGSGLMALNRIEEAVPWLERGLAKVHQQGWILSEMLFANWLAVGYERLGRQGQAEETMLSALALAQPESVLQIFAEHGPWALAVMRRLSTRLHRASRTYRGVTAGFVDEIVALFPDYTGMQDADVALKPIPLALIEPPSERELDVLRLLARGKRNQEIAEALYVTVNTVSFHLKNLYGKLDVHNRTQAVAVARELALVE